MKHSDEQINAKKIKSTPTENINNVDNISVQQNNEECEKGTTLILGYSTTSGLIEKKFRLTSD